MTLALRGVGYRYAGARTPSLLGVDLVLPDGEVVGLVGASEAGKTTLCLVASGLAPRAIGGHIRGRVTLDGEDVDGWPMHRLSQRVGIGFQNPANQLSQVTESVFEEVAFGPMNLGLPRDEVLERTWSAIDALRITALVERDPRRLSGGQQQLVAIAGLLALRPDHLVLDEPTAQLDPAGTRLVADAISRLAAAGAAILVAEQKTDLLGAVAGRVVAIDAGRPVLDGPAATVLGDPALEALGVAPPAVVRLARAAERGGVPAEGRAPGGGPPRMSDSRVPGLRLEAVTYAYPSGVVALESLDLAVAPGERVALVGQNGSGKTTLVRHLNGLLRPTAGRVLIGGEPAAARSVAQLARLVGLVFQDPSRQIFAGSVGAEVEFGPRNLGLRGAELRAAVEAALDRVGLAGETRTNPYDLGESRRKLLAMASVLAMNTPVLVLDEPTTGQDLHGVAIVRAAVDAAAAEGRTVIAISHDMEFVAETFDRVVVLRSGVVILDGAPADVFAEAAWEALASTYLEPPAAARAGARLGLGSTPTAATLVAALSGLAERPSL